MLNRNTNLGMEILKADFFSGWIKWIPFMLACSDFELICFMWE